MVGTLAQQMSFRLDQNRANHEKREVGPNLKVTALTKSSARHQDTFGINVDRVARRKAIL